jgi:hypothetical protein
MRRVLLCFLGSTSLYLTKRKKRISWRWRVASCLRGQKRDPNLCKSACVYVFFYCFLSFCIPFSFKLHFQWPWLCYGKRAYKTINEFAIGTKKLINLLACKGGPCWNMKGLQCIGNSVLVRPERAFQVGSIKGSYGQFKSAMVYFLRSIVGWGCLLSTELSHKWSTYCLAYTLKGVQGYMFNSTLNMWVSWCFIYIMWHVQKRGIGFDHTMTGQPETDPVRIHDCFKKVK